MTTGEVGPDEFRAQAEWQAATVFAAGDARGGPDWLAALRAYLASIAVGNLAWEAVHLPLYTIWTTDTAREKAFAVVHCTGGDLLIALSSLTIALVVAGDRAWPARGFWPVAALAVLLGLGYTAFSEWLNIVIRRAWQYSDLMPVVTVFGFEVGLSPLLQWVVVPSVAFWFARRRGRGRSGARVSVAG